MSGDIIFLDVGGIVLEIDWKHSFEALGLLDAEAQLQAKKKINSWDGIYHYERGNLQRAEFIKGLAELLGLDPSLPVASAFNKLIVGPLPGAEKIFDEFSGRVPIIALSNTNECHHEYQTAQFPILKRFDRFLTSFELGHRKPDPEIFLAAAEAMKIPPQQGIFIDDLLSNVEAARKVGFRAFQTVNSPEKTLAVLKKELGIGGKK